METPAAPTKQLGPSEIAKDWTARGHPTSRQYVDKLMRVGVRGERLEGKHRESLEAAWLWRTTRTDFLKSAKGGASGAPPATGEIAPPSLAPIVDVAGSSLESMLERVRSVENAAFIRWASAKGYDAVAEGKAYEDAAKIRAKVEELVASHHKKIGLVVNLADAQALLEDRLGPMRSALHSLDRELALEFFPEDPGKHRRRFRSVIARVMIASRAVARAKKSLRPASLHVRARAA